MSVEAEIQKARETYRKKKGGALPSAPERKAIAAPAPNRGESIKEYFDVFFTIMKRDIIFGLGLQTRLEEESEFKKQQYHDFMEEHFNGRR